jgi:hypothetical protein
MSLPTELANQVELQNSIENNRAANLAAAEAKRAKLELLRAAKEVVMENYRNSPATSAPITSEDIITMAEALETFANS